MGKVKKRFVGGYLDVTLTRKLARVAARETRGNKTALLAILLTEGVEHLEKSRGARRNRK